MTCDDDDPCTVDFCHGQKDVDVCTHEPSPGCEPDRHSRTGRKDLEEDAARKDP